MKNTQEDWKEVDDYNGIYLISKTGVVKSFHKNSQRIMKLKSEKGYLTVNLYLKTIKKTFKVHRLVAQTFIPNPNKYPQVNHIDGNKSNNNVENLEWCTCQQNVRHAIRTGLSSIERLRHSDEEYVEIANKLRTKFYEHNNRGIILNTETGIYYSSIVQAAESIGRHYSYLHDRLNEKRSTERNIKNKTKFIIV